MKKRVISIITKCYKKWFFDPFTIACDKSPFWSEINKQEILFHAKGLLKAHILTMKWVRNHPMGQARILIGYHEWEENKLL